MLQHPITHFSLCYLLSGWRLKTGQNFKLLALKVVAVAYERWSLTIGAKYSDLTWKHFVLFWKNWSLRRGGHNWKFDCSRKERS